MDSQPLPSPDGPEGEATPAGRIKAEPVNTPARATIKMEMVSPPPTALARSGSEVASLASDEGTHVARIQGGSNSSEAPPVLSIATTQAKNPSNSSMPPRIHTSPAKNPSNSSVPPPPASPRSPGQDGSNYSVPPPPPSTPTSPAKNPSNSSLLPPPQTTETHTSPAKNATNSSLPSPPPSTATSPAKDACSSLPSPPPLSQLEHTPEAKIRTKGQPGYTHSSNKRRRLRQSPEKTPKKTEASQLNLLLAVYLLQLEPMYVVTSAARPPRRILRRSRRRTRRMCLG